MIKTLEKTEGPIDNPETRATLATRHITKTNKTKNKTQKTKKEKSNIKPGLTRVLAESK